MNCAMIDSAEGTRDAAACGNGNGNATEVLYEYGLQVLLLTVLVPITIFRRQISCNAEHREPVPSVSPSIISGRLSTTAVSTSEQASAAASQETQCWDDEEADSLLERASTCYGCSSYHVLEEMLGRFLKFMLPSRLAYAVLNFLTQWWLVAAQQQCLDDILHGAEYWRTSPPPANILIVAHSQESEGQYDRQEREGARIFPNAPEHLPSDVTAHILSFLHPKDVLSFGSVSPAAQVMIRNDSPIWKSLWVRDYAWLVTSWHVGREALHRSWQSLKEGTAGPQPTTVLDQNEVVAQLWNSFHFSKDFYFRFGLCWVDYVLAGQCTAESCLIALGGHVYDLTHFVQEPHTHPGSAETVLVHAGKDCTAVFDGMRHTIHARRMAQQMCVAVDMSRNNNNNNQRGFFGVRPTSQLLMDGRSTTAVSVIPHGRPQSQAAATAATAEAVRHEVLQELSECTVRARRMKDTGGVPEALSELHTYYDPFAGKWKAWYLSAAFEPVFVEDIIVTTSSAMSFLFG